MKNTFLVIVLLLILKASEAQQPLAYFPVKQGIYITFRSIRNNKPLPDTGFTVKERPALRSGGGMYKLVSDSLSGNGLREFKKQYIGFSDGENFYISDRFTTGGERGLTKCMLNGRYILADVHDIDLHGNTIVFSYIIDVSKGLSLSLSKKVIKDIISQYPDIDAEYKSKNHIKDVREILQKINDKQIKNNDDTGTTNG